LTISGIAKPHTISTTWAICETMVKVLSLVVTNYVLIKVMGIDSLEMAFNLLIFAYHQLCDELANQIILDSWVIWR
jgi:hypothetical protein